MPNEKTSTLLVTGGAGFIGSNFVPLALSQGFNVVVVDKLTYAGNERNLERVSSSPHYTFVKADIGDRKEMDAILKNHRPQAILNFAAETHVDRSIDGPAAFIQTNIVGTFVLLEAARNYYEQLKGADRDNFRFLHVSTDEVYGTLGKTGSFSEKTPYAPNSPYAASKAGADHLVHAYHETFGLPTLITNCSNNYGPFQFPEKLIPLIILNALEGKPLPVYGDGGQVRDWIYVEDHCEGVLSVLKQGKVGEKYNIGANEERINLDVVNTVCSVLETVLPPQNNQALKSKGIARYHALIAFVQDRPGHDRRYAIDSTRIRKELGWKPKHSFDNGLKNTVKWYLENRAWCEEIQTGNYRRERLGLSR